MRNTKSLSRIYFFNFTGNPSKPLIPTSFFGGIEKKLHSQTDTEHWFLLLYNFHSQKLIKPFGLQCRHSIWKSANTRKNKCISLAYIFFSRANNNMVITYMSDRIFNGTDIAHAIIDNNNSKITRHTFFRPYKVNPSSTIIFCPLTYFDDSDRRKMTLPVISDGFNMPEPKVLAL